VDCYTQVASNVWIIATTSSIIAAIS